MRRVFLAEDHELMRAGLEGVVARRARMEVCGEAGTLEDALEAIPITAPDVVILGELGGAKDVLRFIPPIREVAGAGGILVLARAVSGGHAQRAMELGAQGYLLISDSSDELVAAMGALVMGRRFLSPSLRQELSTPTGRVGALGRVAPSVLTGRERQVLDLVVAGKRTSEIARLLEISTKTVETHRAAIMRKLQLRRLADVVRYAVQNNLCSSEHDPMVP